jgi:hypothetical protein
LPARPLRIKGNRRAPRYTVGRCFTHGRRASARGAVSVLNGLKLYAQVNAGIG